MIDALLMTLIFFAVKDFLGAGESSDRLTIGSLISEDLTLIYLCKGMRYCPSTNGLLIKDCR